MEPWMIYRLPYGKFLKQDTEALKTMREAGINLVSISPMNTTNAFGEPYCIYPPIWQYDESYDFSSLDQHIADVLELNPDARFFCAVDLNSPLWLYAASPWTPSTLCRPVPFTRNGGISRRNI